MSGVFQAYIEEFDSFSSNISTNNSQLRDFGRTSEDKGKSLISKTEKLFIQCNEVLQQLQIEVRSVDASKRKSLGDQIQERKSNLTTLKSEFERAKEQCQRSALIGDKSIEQRSKLMNTNDKVNRQTEILMAAQRTVAETEEVGQEITKELASNRDKIKAANDKVDEFSGLTGIAKDIVLALDRRETQQKFVIGGVFLAICIAIIVTICHFYAKPGKSQSSAKHLRF